MRGRAFLAGATVIFNGGTIPATVTNATTLSFAVPGTGGSGSAGGTVTIQVRNPDGRVSNSRTAQQPHILEVPFKYGQHNLSFPNFTDGLPDWGTFEDTFGTAEVSEVPGRACAKVWNSSVPAGMPLARISEMRVY